jgi:hypothetical protein
MASPGFIGGALESPVALSQDTFSGADIRACIGQFPFAELQAVNYSVTREKAPIYTMGSADCRSYSRNKRGIAGSLIWVNFDRHALLNVIYNHGGRFVSNNDDIRPQYMVDSPGSILTQSAIFNATLTRADGLPVGATIDNLDLIPMDTVSADNSIAAPWYADQVLPFDITLAATNELGRASACRIYGVEILNEAWGTSIDDAVQEQQATFVARSVEPWQAVASAFSTQLGTGILQG